MSSQKNKDSEDDGSFRENLDRTLLAIPLLQEIHRRGEKDTGPLDVIIDLNINYAGGRRANALEAAKDKVARLIAELVEGDKSHGVDKLKSRFAYQQIFARLTVPQIQQLAKSAIELNGDGGKLNPIYKIWPDNDIEAFLTKSVRTIKADASLVSFGATGEDICWAVIDSGIDSEHIHFKRHKNLELVEPLRHMDFTLGFGEGQTEGQSCTDPNGHGTHVAGILAGEFDIEAPNSDTDEPATAIWRKRDEAGNQEYVSKGIARIRGVAPKCRLLSLRVLDENGRGKESNIIAALGYISQINASSRWPLIHGVNLSVGYEFKAEWFGCGQSPLCVEVDRLVRRGFPVVVAAGNTGYGKLRLHNDVVFRSGLPLSINDPGNAALAITVGSTHREQPHTYGISYFSSKGPTGDGRLKPDLVAPGERILSCAAGSQGSSLAQSAGVERCDYREESGTSMAAPHVSGAIAAFFSIRPEFIGQPERIKEIFMSTCTDLGRDKYFQGSGLIDLMRAIQSI